MKSDWTRTFLRKGRRSEPLFEDAEIALYPREYYGYSRQIRCEQNFIFDVRERNHRLIIGEIALRIGDSPEQFYLGHIGYHIDPPYRGHGYAAKACALCKPLLEGLGQRSVVITTDPDNLPSIRTCLNLGCEKESTVRVPLQVREKLEISAEKIRFVWILG